MILSLFFFLFVFKQRTPAWGLSGDSYVGVGGLTAHGLRNGVCIGRVVSVSYRTASRKAVRVRSEETNDGDEVEEARAGGQGCYNNALPPSFPPH